ncbi:hypothetical protein Ga0100231_017975 [Opitutaceae bacterium TAV4]|nr:hypothetical protein Ga0100231_017975 [Opitutaceae bacterium TAV4]RRK00024.1 hypothetical protein Ga0100230_018655 [Opitutaceae bacterium TAV3]
MIRILIVDDEDPPGFISSLKREIEGSTKNKVDLIHINPTPFLHIEPPKEGLRKLEEKVQSTAVQCCDIAAFDINLGDVGRPEENSLRITLQLVEAFREKNKAATVFLYSGTLARILEYDLTKNKTATEGTLKRIFRAQISAFLSRSEISTEIQVSASNPTWLLRVDKLLEQHSREKCSVSGSAFNGKTFAELIQSFRSQDNMGEQITNHIIELGIAGIVDLHT